MLVTEALVLDALKVVKDPDLHRDIVALGFVKNLKIDRDQVSFTVELTTPACPVKDQMRDQARAAVLQVPGVSAVDVQMTARVREAVGGDGTRSPIASERAAAGGGQVFQIVEPGYLAGALRRYRKPSPCAVTETPPGFRRRSVLSIRMPVAMGGKAVGCVAI